MSGMKIGIQLASLRLPFKKALHVARQLGASAVEIDARGEIRPENLSETALRELRKLLDDHDLKVAALGFHTRRGYNVPEGLEARVAATKRALELAYRLRAPVVINHVGFLPTEPSGPEWQLLLDALGDLGRHGQHVGAVLAAESGGEEPAALARLLAALEPGAIGVNLDPGNLVVNGYSPLAAVEALGPAILHVHAKDGVRDRAQSRGTEVPLGRGSAEFPALVGALEAHGYRGYYTIERTGGRDPLFEIGEAVKYLKSL
jgi:sugar phosphate isomerase/epimerase